jgi:hypothetical protein
LAISLAIVFVSGFSFTKRANVAPTPIPLIEESISETPTKANYIFDVPSLIGKDLTETTKVLGTAEGKNPTGAQIQKGVRQWDKTFSKDGHKLLITYVVTSGKIIDFFLETDDPSGKTKDKAHLLELTNATENDSRYTVEFVKALVEPENFTGIKITPK